MAMGMVAMAPPSKIRMDFRLTFHRHRLAMIPPVMATTASGARADAPPAAAPQHLWKKRYASGAPIHLKSGVSPPRALIHSRMPAL